MGCSNATATSEKLKQHENEWETLKRQPNVEENKKKEESIDEWWAKIKKEHEESKNKKITMNPGWQNPFGSKLSITRETNKSKDQVKKISKQTTSSHNNCTNESKNQKEQDNERGVLQYTNNKSSSVHETDDFVAQVQKGKYTERLPIDNFNKNNDVAMYDQFAFDSKRLNHNIKALPMKSNKSLNNVQESEEDLKGIFDKEDEINGLLKDLKTENDEVPVKPKFNSKHVELDISRISKKENKFDDSGQLNFDTELERMLGTKSNEHQTGNQQVIRFDNLHKPELHGFDESDFILTPESKNKSKPKPANNKKEELDNFDW